MAKKYISASKGEKMMKEYKKSYNRVKDVKNDVHYSNRREAKKLLKGKYFSQPSKIDDDDYLLEEQIALILADKNNNLQFSELKKLVEENNNIENQLKEKYDGLTELLKESMLENMRKNEHVNYLYSLPLITYSIKNLTLTETQDIIKKIKNKVILPLHKNYIDSLGLTESKNLIINLINKSMLENYEQLDFANQREESLKRYIKTLNEDVKKGLIISFNRKFDKQLNESYKEPSHIISTNYSLAVNRIIGDILDNVVLEEVQEFVNKELVNDFNENGELVVEQTPYKVFFDYLETKFGDNKDVLQKLVCATYVGVLSKKIVDEKIIKDDNYKKYIDLIAKHVEVETIINEKTEFINEMMETTPITTSEILYEDKKRIAFIRLFDKLFKLNLDSYEKEYDYITLKLAQEKDSNIATFITMLDGLNNEDFAKALYEVLNQNLITNIKLNEAIVEDIRIRVKSYILNKREVYHINNTIDAVLNNRIDNVYFDFEYGNFDILLQQILNYLIDFGFLSNLTEKHKNDEEGIFKVTEYENNTDQSKIDEYLTEQTNSIIMSSLMYENFFLKEEFEVDDFEKIVEEENKDEIDQQIESLEFIKDSIQEIIEDNQNSKTDLENIEIMSESVASKRSNLNKQLILEEAQKAMDPLYFNYVKNTSTIREITNSLRETYKDEIEKIKKEI